MHDSANRSRVSRRMEQVQAPMIPVVGQWIAETPGVISLGQGVVHYRPPEAVARAVSDALGQAQLDRYGPVQGLEPLLEEITNKLRRDNAVTAGPDRRLLVTAGSNMGFLNAVLAVADVGDEIILLSPFYFNHEMALGIAGCRAVIVPTDDEHQIDLAAIAAACTSRTRAVVTISPNNPTGAVYRRQDLAAVNRLCGERGLMHISDEAYEYFVYEGAEHFSPASLAGSEPHTISLFSLSKSYGMAGWRAGYMLIPAHLETAVKKAQDTNLICPPQATQVAALAALRVGSDWCRQRIAGFAEVRRAVLEQLGSLDGPVRVPSPAGAFYVLIELPDAGRADGGREQAADLQLVERLIREHGVAVMPGSTFGASGCRLRIAYGALDGRTVVEGMRRLTEGLNRLM